ncbi:MAG: hypothetical protein QM765_12220 [Myxococcales bacterium]
MLRSALAVALFVLPACGASLSDFSTSALSLDQQADGRVVVELTNPRGNCATLGGDVRATVNGLPMALDSSGGEAGSRGGWSCRAPQFSLSSADVAGLSGADAEVVIGDGSTRLVLEARNFFAARSMVADRYEDGGDHGRKTMTFRWVPETDAHRSASWRLRDATGAHFGEARIDSHFVAVDLPGSAAERATLWMEGRAQAPVVRCQGVADCRATVRTTTGDLAL